MAFIQHFQSIKIIFVLIIIISIISSIKSIETSFDHEDIDYDIDNTNLFYSDYDDLPTTEQPLLPSSSSQNELSMRELMLEILRNSNISNNNQCDRYKQKIQDFCLKKYFRRSRIRFDSKYMPNEETINDLHSIPNVKQICCEFRSTYLNCLITSINYICHPNEFNNIYKEIYGMNEICSKFYSRSSKKCRRRYKIIPPVNDGGDNNIAENTDAGFTLPSILPSLNLTRN